MRFNLFGFWVPVLLPKSPKNICFFPMELLKSLVKGLTASLVWNRASCLEVAPERLFWARNRQAGGCLRPLYSTDLHNYHHDGAVLLVGL